MKVYCLPCCRGSFCSTKTWGIKDTNSVLDWNYICIPCTLSWWNCPNLYHRLELNTCITTIGIARIHVSQRLELPEYMYHNDWNCPNTCITTIGIARIHVSQRLELPEYMYHNDWNCPNTCITTIGIARIHVSQPDCNPDRTFKTRHFPRS